jgi:tetraacyldisaccharide 4'-kinase
MSILRFLLFPLAIIYNCITRVRNHMYNSGYKSSTEFDRVVISVGNLNVGGSGKTPMIEYLIRLFSSTYKVATLSRGYGRRTRGFRMATEQDSAKTIGDEPFQFYRKFNSQVPVFVGEDRALAIPELLLEKPDTDIILLDDAFQHRSVKPSFSLLLTEYNNFFFDDYVLPAGNLREARRGAQRANVIVVTKCRADIASVEKESIRKRISRYAPSCPVYFSSIKYGAPLPINDHVWLPSVQVIAVSGIAHAEQFEMYLRSKYSVGHHFNFADHHAYTAADLKQIQDKAAKLGRDTVIITTEKDMVKLLPFGGVLTCGWFYIPIETFFIENGEEFDANMLKTVKS